MKRLSAIILSAVMALSVCACGGKKYNDEEVKIFTDIVVPIAADMGYDDVKFQDISTLIESGNYKCLGCYFKSTKFNQASLTEKMELLANIDYVFRKVYGNRVLAKNPNFSDCLEDWIVFTDGSSYYRFIDGAFGRVLYSYTTKNNFYASYKTVLKDEQTTSLCDAANQMLRAKGLSTEVTSNLEKAKKKEAAKKKTTKKCETCNGTGYIKYNYGSSDLEALLDGEAPYTVSECYKCHGTGKVTE